jgi:hypothetical protein
MHRFLTTLLLAPLLVVLCGIAHAEGVLTHMSGPVSVQRAGGKALQAEAGTQVNVGDTLITGQGAYVRMAMTDGSEIVLRPDSQFVMEGYRFVETEPAQDNFVFRMIRGGLRTITGYIGKRGNRDAYKAVTATSTIGIRGTQYDLRVCEANCGALADGTYLAVRFGAIETANALGMLTVSAGQFAFVPAVRPPIMLPRDPGIGFTPPPSIPKLDEKKKAQAATPVASGGAVPAATATAAPAQSSNATQRSAAAAPDARTAVSAVDTSVKADTPAVSSAPSDSSATLSASGPDCVVQ